jgi:uncharacterized protein YkuJ
MTRRLLALSQKLDAILKARRSPGERYRRADGSLWEKPAGGGKVVRVAEQPDASGEGQAAVIAEKTVRKTCLLLTNVLEGGVSIAVKNKKLGDITIDAGQTGKGGYGLRHIIEQRYKKDGKSDNEITAIFIALKNTLKSGVIIRDEEYLDAAGNDKGAYLLEKDGVVAVVSKMRFDDKEQFVLTGYENTDKKEEAADAIKKVISKYGYTPEFSSLKRQVGAVIASLALSHNAVKKSRGRLIKKRRLGALRTLSQELERFKKRGLWNGL